jgi:3-phenylpropionate/cinnamic acid dioxygenase small subunit
MDDDVVREVERFLYREARLLDERRLHERLEVLTDDIRYWMAGRSQPLSEVGHSGEGSRIAIALLARRDQRDAGRARRPPRHHAFSDRTR